MDLCALNLSSGGGGGVAGLERLWRRKGMALSRPSWKRFLRGVVEDDSFGRFGEIAVSARRAGIGGYRSLEIKATGRRKKDNENSPSSGSNDPLNHGGNNQEDSNSISDKFKSEGSNCANLDWRTFRANLIAQEQVPLEDSERSKALPNEPLKKIDTKWAHPLATPETGCVLVATEKLDGVRNFERTVILLLRLGTRDPREGPFGIILNRPLHKKIKHMKPTNVDLATTFSECPLHFGGPLDASMFLLRTGEGSLQNFEQVVPGISFGARNSLDEATNLVKEGVLRPRDFRFFVGYAGWQLDQLIDEIESEYWVVAACSSDLINSTSSHSSAGMWEEILQLMGGQYSELSRKPRQDSS